MTPYQWYQSPVLHVLVIKMEKWTGNYRHTIYSDHTRHCSAAESLSHPAHSQVFPPGTGEFPPQEPASPCARGPGTQQSPSQGKEHHLAETELHHSYLTCGHCSHQCFSKAATVYTKPSAASRCVCAQSPQRTGRAQVLLRLNLHPLTSTNEADVLHMY